MVRTQIQLTESQAEKLRALAARLDVSVAEVVRRLVATTESPSARATAEERRARALAVVGRFASGHTDVSAEHDRHLSEAFRG